MSYAFWAVRANREIFGCNTRAEAVRKAGKGGEVRVVNPRRRATSGPQAAFDWTAPAPSRETPHEAKLREFRAEMAIVAANRNSPERLAYDARLDAQLAPLHAAKAAADRESERRRQLIAEENAERSRRAHYFDVIEPADTAKKMRHNEIQAAAHARENAAIEQRKHTQMGRNKPIMATYKKSYTPRCGFYGCRQPGREHVSGELYCTKHAAECRRLRNPADTKLLRFPEGVMTESQWVQRYADRVESVKVSWESLVDRRKYHRMDGSEQAVYEARLRKKAEKPQFRAWKDGIFYDISAATYTQASRKRNGSTMASPKHFYEEAQRDKWWREVGKPKRDAEDAAHRARQIRAGTRVYDREKGDFIYPGSPDYPTRNPPQPRLSMWGKPAETPAADIWYISKDWAGFHKSWRSRGDALRAAGNRGSIFESPHPVKANGQPVDVRAPSTAPTWTSTDAVYRHTQDAAKLSAHTATLAAQRAEATAHKATEAAKRAATAAHEAEYAAREAERKQRETARSSAQVHAQEMLKATRAAEYNLVEATKTAVATAQEAEARARSASARAQEFELRAGAGEQRIRRTEQALSTLRAQEARAMLGQTTAPETGNRQPMGSDIPREQQFANLEID